MNNLDTVGLILLFGAAILGGVLYFVLDKNKKSVKALPSPTMPRENERFESAGELFPRIEFPPEPRHEFIPELPAGYHDDKITIMARDPEWIYAYWDISEEKQSLLKHNYGRRWENSLPVMRVYDVTGLEYFNGLNANSFYDVIINDFARSWYLHVGVPNRTYCVDLGRILNDGTYVVVARSNYTFTPRNSISDKSDPEWLMISENERKLYGRIGFNAPSSPELFQREKP